MMAAMDFESLRADFLRFTTDIVYCTVTTVDSAGRPRSRVMHPIFEVVDGHPRGWALTDRTPLKDRHLAANPYVACFYWSPAQNTVAIDCTAEWVEDDAVLRQVWDSSPLPNHPAGATCRGTARQASTIPASTCCGCCRTASRCFGLSSSERETSRRERGDGTSEVKFVLRQQRPRRTRTQVLPKGCDDPRQAQDTACGSRAGSQPSSRTAVSKAYRSVIPAT